jgi:hypothetical protein
MGSERAGGKREALLSAWSPREEPMVLTESSKL